MLMEFSDDENEALETVQDYINEARIQLQDLVPAYRYDDPSLLTALNITLQMARQMRADLFVFYNNGRTPSYVQNDTTEVPIEPQFRNAILYGMCGHAFARDQEDYQDARATSFLNIMSVTLTGRPWAAAFAGGSAPGAQR
jgi:hypothetical protein